MASKDGASPIAAARRWETRRKQPGSGLGHGPKSVVAYRLAPSVLPACYFLSGSDTRSGNLLKIKLAFVPPKPNEFDKA